jgi:photosystem II stability/assembly factor-like uncharacterized protein
MSKKFTTALGAAFAVVLVTAIGAFAAVTAGNTGWHWGNPLPQGNTLTTLDNVGDRVYAGGATGTLVRSSDAGASWTGVRTGLLDDIRLVRAMSADSFVFASTCALRRSDDGGATVRRLTWSPSDESCAVGIQSFYFPTSSVGYLLLESGDVFTTADGGDSWSKKTALPGSKSGGGAGAVTDIWFTASGTGVASSNGQIFQTTDGATSWTPVGTGKISQFNFVSATDGFAIASDGLFYKTVDGGSVWTLVPTPASGPIAAGGADTANLHSFDCADVSICIATNAKGTQLVRTIDGGTTWTSVTPSNSPMLAAGLASTTRAIAVGGGGATVVSDDSGQTWTTISAAALGVFNNVRAESASTAYAFGENGALARTTDGGNSWSPVGVSTSSRILDVSFPTASRGFVLDAAGVVLRTNNAGASWQFLDTGTTATPYAMTAPTDSSVVLVGPKGIRRSVDNGDSFESASGKNLKKTALNSIDRAGGALFAYSRKTVLVSKDTGKSWAKFKLPRVVVKDLDMISAKTGYLLDTRDELYVTRTGGKKWSRIETTGAGFANGIAFGDMTHGYITDDTGRILYTSDGAKTWSRQYPFYDKDGGSSQLIDAPSGASAFMLVVGTNRLFATANGGQIGNASTLTIKASSKKVKKNTVIKVTGKLSPNSGGERVTVLARQAGAKSGTGWVSQERTVAANGTFTTSWKIKKGTVFIARWSGDSARDGDGAPAISVKVKK